MLWEQDLTTVTPPVRKFQLLSWSSTPNSYWKYRHHVWSEKDSVPLSRGFDRKRLVRLPQVSRCFFGDIRSWFKVLRYSEVWFSGTIWRYHSLHLHNTTLFYYFLLNWQHGFERLRSVGLLIIWKMSDADLYITAPFNNMPTVKIQSSTQQMGLLPPMKCLAAPPSFRLLLSTVSLSELYSTVCS